MITGLTLDEVIRYTSKFDEGEKPTIWILGMLDAVLLAQIEDEQLLFSVKEGGEGEEASTQTKLKINERNVELVRHGLKGFEVFCDKDGQEIKYETISKPGRRRPVTIVSDRTIKRIPPIVVKELAEKILEINSPSEEEVGNSD
jgi:hypothetical protein